MFSTLVSFFIALSFLFSSGIIDYIESIVSFKYSIILIQCLVRPISSSSSMSIMLECYSLYGSDHIISIISTGAISVSLVYSVCYLDFMRMRLIVR